MYLAVIDHGDTEGATRIALLGRVEVTIDGQARLVAGPKERTVLAVLALAADRTVSDGELVDALWTDPPTSAGKVLQNLVMRVRKAIGPDLIARGHGGYRLLLPARAVDAERARALLKEAGIAGERGNNGQAASLLRRALDLWHGPPLAGVADTPSMAAETARLVELRLSVVEAWIDAELVLGHHDSVIPELEALTAQNPYRQRLWGQHMVALYRAGRQGDALRAFQQLRLNLAEHLGLEPSREIAALDRAIASGASQLDARPRSLPSGTVSFLLTDVEGSTRHLLELGSAFSSSLEEAFAVIREAVTEWGGCEVNTTGDGILVAFAEPLDAVSAAVKAQQELLTSPADLARLKVRMGIHTGPATPTEQGDYISLTVNKVARVCDAAHGGQILLSAEAAALVSAAIEGKASIRFLGSYMLKGFSDPVELTQLMAPGLGTEFPPVRAARAGSQLPADRSSFVGRDLELSEVVYLTETYDLVTVVGPGGVGKTRLLHESVKVLEQRFPGGVWFVALSGITEDALVESTVATTMGLIDRPRLATLDAIIERLSRVHSMLVLDNCEHVMGGVTEIANAILSSCPSVQLLASSREPLNLSAEAVLSLQPLEVPVGRVQSAARARAVDAVRLFEDRARQALADFAVSNDNAGDVARICQMLDGLPLAIELIAPLVRRVPLATLARQVESEALSSVEGRGRERRHLTLAATIDWSYGLLSTDEQQVFNRLGVFAGGFTAEAACHVASVSEQEGARTMEIVGNLTEKSLLYLDRSSTEPRYHLLETIRRHALASLADSEQFLEIGRAHLDWYLRLADKTAPEPAGWQVLAVEYDNLRAAIAFADNTGDTESLCRLAIDLTPFWRARGYFKEGRRWLAAARHTAVDAATRHRLTLEEGNFAMVLGAYADTRRLVSQALEGFTEDRDRLGAARALHSLGRLAGYQGDNESSRAHLDAALADFRAAGDERGAASVLRDLGRRSRHQGDYETAYVFLQEAVDVCRNLGDRGAMADAMSDLGRVATRLGDFDDAHRYLKGALDLYSDLGDELGIANAWYGLGRAAWKSGDPSTASDLLRSAVHRFRELEDPQGAAWPVCSLGGIALEAGDVAAARSDFEDALAVGRALASGPIIVAALIGLADVSAADGELRGARAYLDEARTLAQAIGYMPETMDIEERLERLSDS